MRASLVKARRVIADEAGSAQSWKDIPEQGHRPDVLLWWEALQQDKVRGNIPAVFPFIRALFSIPASSAGSERFFKGASFLEDGRPSLSMDQLSRQVRVRDMMNQPLYSFGVTVEAVKQLKAKQAKQGKVGRKYHKLH